MNKRYDIGYSENFVVKISSIWNSLGVIIPYNIVNYTGIKKGDTIKVIFKKIENNKKGDIQ